MVGIAIENSLITWRRRFVKEESECTHTAGNADECANSVVDILSGNDRTHKRVAICSFNRDLKIRDALTERLSGAGIAVHYLSPGDALGLAILRQSKPISSMAVLYFNGSLCGSLIFQSRIFSRRNGQDPIGSQAFILPSHGNQPVSMEAYFTAEHIKRIFFEKTGKERSVNEIIDDYRADGLSKSHPFYTFHDCFAYLVSNINYNFDPAEIIYYGDIFTSRDNDAFKNVWISPIVNKIIGDTTDVNFRRNVRNGNMLLSGTCMYINDTEAFPSHRCLD